MAISYIGYVGVSDNSQNHNANLTIPSGATFALIGIAGWRNGDMDPSSISLDGHTANLVARSTYSAGEETCWLYEVSGFNTGSKNFTCNWDGSPNDGIRYMLMFFSGVDTGDPIEDFDIQHTAIQNQTLTTANMTSSVSHMVCAVAAGSGRGSCTMDGAYGQTSVDSGTYNSADYGAAYKAGGGATDTMTCILSYGALIGCTLSPEAGAAALEIAMTATNPDCLVKGVKVVG